MSTLKNIWVCYLFFLFTDEEEINMDLLFSVNGNDTKLSNVRLRKFVLYFLIETSSVCLYQSM